MFSGIQEILVILLIILAIFFVPRMLPRRQSLPPPAATVSRRLAARLTGRMRLAIVVSVVWLLVAVAYFEPWYRPLPPFLYFGVGPVAIAWGVIWIFTGFRKK